MPWNSSLLVMVGVVLVLGALAYARGGAALVRDGLGRGGGLLLEFSLLLVVSFLAAGLATVLVPRAWVQGALGDDAGLRGILLATGVGALTPAGPFVAMPIAAILLRSGAGPGPVVAFLTGWSLLAVHRLIAWEVPIVGLRFAALRWSVSLLLPVLAGLAARWLGSRG